MEPSCSRRWPGSTAARSPGWLESTRQRSRHQPGPHGLPSHRRTRSGQNPLVARFGGTPLNGPARRRHRPAASHSQQPARRLIHRLLAERREIRACRVGLELSAHPGRAAQARIPRRSIHDPSGPQAATGTSGTAPGPPTRHGDGSYERRPRQCWPWTSSTSTARSPCLAQPGDRVAVNRRKGISVDWTPLPIAQVRILPT